MPQNTKDFVLQRNICAIPRPFELYVDSFKNMFANTLLAIVTTAWRRGFINGKVSAINGFDRFIKSFHFKSFLLQTDG